MENNNCTTAIKNVLAEASALMGYELELVPGHEYPIHGQNNSLGYKFHRKNDPDNRKMSLAVDLAVDCQEAFVQLPDGKPTLNSKANDRLFAAFESFFSAGNSEQHTFLAL